MRPSVAADTGSSVPNVYPDEHTKSKQGKESLSDGGASTKPEFKKDQDLTFGLDSQRFKGSGSDVTDTDSDSGAIDDTDFTSSGVDIVPSNFIPTDGGYGWIVVIASFFNAFIIDGVGSCYGLIYPHVMEKYEASASIASFAGSLFNALLIMGSVSAMLVRRYGYRRVTMSGGVLACGAFLLSAWSPNVICFVIFYGLFTGCACGLVFLPSVVIVNSYFHQKRGLANGIITSGSGAGLLVLAQLVNFLLEEFSLEGTLLVLAGVLLNMCVFSSVYRRPKDLTGSPATRGNHKEVTVLTSGNESSDSGLLTTPSETSSVETVSTLSREVCVSAAENQRGENKIEVAGDTFEKSSTIGMKQNRGKGVGDDINDEDIECSAPGHTGYMIGRPQVDNLQCTSSCEELVDMSKENGNAEVCLKSQELSLSTEVPIEDSMTNDVILDPGKSYDLSEETRITVSPYPEMESGHVTFNNSLKRETCIGRRCYQFWMSAHNIPNHGSPLQEETLHSSAYDVTRLDSTSAKGGNIYHGLMPLAERSAFMVNPLSMRQKGRSHDHYQLDKRCFAQSQNHQHHFSGHQLAHHLDNQLLSHQRDNLCQSHHRQHHQHFHHTNHISELDKGSNFYLTGSISTLLNLQAKHILHQTTSQFLTHDTALVKKSNGAKSHPSHRSKSRLSLGSKSHLSEPSCNLRLHLSIPNKDSTTRNFISQSSHSQQNVALLSMDETDPLPGFIFNKNTGKSFLTLCPIESLHLSSKANCHQYQTAATTESSLFVSQRSLNLDEEQVVEAVNLDSDCGSFNSLALPTSGYSLRQLIKMPCFLLFCVGSCLIQIGYPIPSIFVADLAYQQGLTTADTAIIMGIMGGLNIVGRLLSGLLANLGVNPLTLLYTSLFLGGVACLLTPLYTTLWSLMLFSGLFGFLLGAFPPVQPLVIVEYFGLDSLASVFGFLTTIKGASSMLGPPLAGLVYDASGEYPMSFVFGGVVFLLSAAVHTAMPFFRPK